jgi:hypothetical protein
MNISEGLDVGHLHLAAVMHRQGVSKIDISAEEMDAVVKHIRANQLQMIVMMNDAGATIEFLPQGMLDNINPDGTLEPGTALN